MRYILVNMPSPGHDNLGHELFFTRKIFIKLLERNLVTTNDCVVTLNDDRKFLYNKNHKCYIL